MGQRNLLVNRPLAAPSRPLTSRLPPLLSQNRNKTEMRIREVRTLSGGEASLPQSPLHRCVGSPHARAVTIFCGLCHCY